LHDLRHATVEAALEHYRATAMDGLMPVCSQYCPNLLRQSPSLASLE